MATLTRQISRENHRHMSALRQCIYHSLTLLINSREGLECTRLLYSGTTNYHCHPQPPPRIYIGYQIPSTTPALLYIGVARATSAKLRPDSLASCDLPWGIPGAKAFR